MDRIAKAREFYREHGRDIDRVRFEYHVGSASQGELLEVLGRYQNGDGGFGNGLEPDIEAPDSNPFATEQALLFCLQAGVAPQEQLLQRTVQYLEESQGDDGTWRFSPAVYAHEMAPWYREWEWPNLSPSCSLAGLLRELHLGSERLHARVEHLFEELAQPEALLTDDFYAIRPYSYYFLPEWEHPQRDLYIAGVLWWLIRQHTEGTIADAPHFFAYVRGPQTYTGRTLPARILSQELDRLEAEQMADGGWPSPYDEIWRGVETVQSFLVLQAFGRL